MEDSLFSLGPCGGGLWFGTDQCSSLPSDGKTIQDWPCIQWVSAQVGGIFCHHESLFGVEFAIRDRDPLAQIGESYRGSNLPGVQNSEYKTPTEKIEDLRKKLIEIGLCLDERRAAHFAEAYLPLTTTSAWQYVLAKDLRLIMPQGRPGTEFSTRSNLGLESWDCVRDYLKAAWQDLIRDENPPTDWLAAAVFANTD